MSEETTPAAPVQNIVHTPGPWKYHDSGSIVMTEDGQMSVADVRGFGRLEKDFGLSLAIKIMDKNGQLIAAAPEMFRIIQILATADWIGESELNLWRKACREIMQKVG
jgi:hypothetical protein